MKRLSAIACLLVLGCSSDGSGPQFPRLGDGATPAGDGAIVRDGADVAGDAAAILDATGPTDDGNPFGYGTYFGPCRPATDGGSRCDADMICRSGKCTSWCGVVGLSCPPPATRCLGISGGPYPGTCD